MQLIYKSSLKISSSIKQRNATQKTTENTFNSIYSTQMNNQGQWFICLFLNVQIQRIRLLNCM